MSRGLSDEERSFVAEAAAYLERPSFAMRAQRLLGRPVEGLLSRLPEPASRAIDHASEAALRRAFDVALIGLPREHATVEDRDVQQLVAETFAGGQRRTIAAGASGFIGGLLGGITLTAELGATTVVMLRAIADIAGHLGADLDDPAQRLECLAVFALGAGHGSPSTVRAAGSAGGELGSKTAYYATRVGLQRATAEVARAAAGVGADHVAKAVLRSRSPLVAELVGKILARYGLVVSQKSALQLLPIIGAATAAAVNVAFIDHYHQVARYHFGLRLLERRHGEAVVRLAFEGEAQRQALTDES